MRMVVHLSGNRSVQNDSKNGGLEWALYVALDSAPKVSFLGALKNA